MERYGTPYPAQDIGELLRSADLTHVSNEIPFTPECPFPELYPGNLIFCSDPKYISLLEEIGTDVVELTGDHFSDYGPEANLFTLDLYDQQGWHITAACQCPRGRPQFCLISIRTNRLFLM
jgi:poly-gamma-glutamate synthesis protein (capsule biosynthesis protein)